MAIPLIGNYYKINRVYKSDMSDNHLGRVDLLYPVKDPMSSTQIFDWFELRKVNDDYIMYVGLRSLGNSEISYSWNSLSYFGGFDAVVIYDLNLTNPQSWTYTFSPITTIPCYDANRFNHVTLEWLSGEPNPLHSNRQDVPIGENAVFKLIPDSGYTMRTYKDSQVYQDQQTYDNLEIDINGIKISLDEVSIEFDEDENLICSIPAPNGTVMIYSALATPVGFSLYSNDGVTLLGSVTGYNKLLKLAFSINNDSRTLTFTVTNSDLEHSNDVSITWNTPVTEDIYSYGVSLFSGLNNNPIVLNGQTINVEYNMGITLYESFMKKQPEPVVGEFSIYFYNMTTEVNRVDKTSFLTNELELTGTLRKGASMLSPSIDIELSTIPNFNYCYIPVFNRYYFVDEIISIQKNIWRINMSIDVLHTYRSQIKLQRGFIERGNTDFNVDIVDPERVVRNEPDISIEYANMLVPFSMESLDHQLVLTVIGKDAS